MAHRDFLFVVSEGPGLPRDPALRTVIRKQAMKDVADARKKRVSIQREDLKHRGVEADSKTASKWQVAIRTASGQRDDAQSPKSKLPDDCCLATPPDSHGVEAVSERSSASDEATPLPTGSTELIKIPMANPTPAYESLCAKRKFDLCDLSVLTSFGMGQSTMLAMTEDPGLLTTLLGHRTPSYLPYVPSRYGCKPYLTAVVDCVTAKARSALSPMDTGLATTAAQLYTKALRVLQNALVRDQACRDADLLCAVQMLSIYEVREPQVLRRILESVSDSTIGQLLEPQRTFAFSRHVDGSAQLIRYRSPSNFKSAYEQSLFLAHLGPAMSEAFYSGKPCYLAQNCWLDLYQSLVEETQWLTHRSPLTIRVRTQMIRLPGMLIETTKVITNSPHHHQEGGVTHLERKARKFHQILLGCLADYKAHVMRTSMSTPPPSEATIRREIFGTTLECLCCYKRLLGALCERERLQLEVEVQALALQISGLQSHASGQYSWIFTNLEDDIAYIMQCTRSEWEEDLNGQAPGAVRSAAIKRWHNFCSHLHMSCDAV